MSHAAIVDTAHRDALRWTHPVDTLGLLHVPFDELLGSNVIESKLREEASRRGKAVLIGASGSGKSSAISSVFGPLSEDLPERVLPIRVPVLLAPASLITEPLGFAQHLLQHVAAWAEQVITVGAQGKAKQAAGATVSGDKGGAKLSFKIPVPVHHVPVEVGVELRTAAVEIHDGLNATNVQNGVDGLVGAFDEQDREPFFVIDESDTWNSLSGIPDALDIARDFYGKVVNWMARDFDCGFLVAAHNEYASVAAYGKVAELIRELRIPDLPDPAQAVAMIVDRRLSEFQVEASHGDVFDDSALAMLGDVYSETHDMRRTLRVAAFAVETMADDLTVSSVTGEAIDKARLLA